MQKVHFNHSLNNQYYSNILYMKTKSKLVGSNMRYERNVEIVCIVLRIQVYVMTTHNVLVYVLFLYVYYFRPFTYKKKLMLTTKQHIMYVLQPYHIFSVIFLFYFCVLIITQQHNVDAFISSLRVMSIFIKKVTWKILP